MLPTGHSPGELQKGDWELHADGRRLCPGGYTFSYAHAHAYPDFNLGAANCYAFFYICAHTYPDFNPGAANGYAFFYIYAHCYPGAYAYRHGHTASGGGEGDRASSARASSSDPGRLRRAAARSSARGRSVL